MKRSLVTLTVCAAMLLSACSSKEEAGPAEAPSAPAASAEATQSTDSAMETPTAEASSEPAQNEAMAGELALAVPEIEGFVPQDVRPPEKIIFAAPSTCVLATGVDAPPEYQGATDRAASEYAMEHLDQAFGASSVISADPVQEVKLADGTQLLIRSIVLEKDGKQAPLTAGVRIDVESGKAIHFLGACPDLSPIDPAEVNTFISSLRLESGNPGAF